MSRTIEAIYHKYIGPKIHEFVHAAARARRRNYVPQDPRFAEKLAEVEARQRQDRPSFSGKGKTTGFVEERFGVKMHGAGGTRIEDNAEPTVVYATVLRAFGQNMAAHSPGASKEQRALAYRQKDDCLMQLTDWRRAGVDCVRLGIERDKSAIGNLSCAQVSFVTRGRVTHQFHMPYTRFEELVRGRGFGSVEEFIGKWDFDVEGIGNTRKYLRKTA